METMERIEQALNLRQEVERFAHLMLEYRDTEHDRSRQSDRVRLQALSLPENENVVVSGAARFSKRGDLRALGVRKTEQGRAGSVELTLRTTRSKLAIIKKTVDPEQRNYSTVAKAWFRFDGGVIRYQEETTRRNAAG
ncbi:MAG: hypothetical protein WC423_03770 [Vulcanimicrobiota bacterium]